MVTYELINRGSSSSPGLQDLLREIKSLEITLKCHLIAIHVPGVSMIRQGTDGLSRGFWLAPHRARLSPSVETACVFRGALPTPSVVTWLKAIVCCDRPDMTHHWLILTSMASWAPGDCLGRSVLGFPPPHLARQMVTQVLLAWAESPLTTSALFLIPRVFQRQWRRANKALSIIGLVPTCHIHPVDVFNSEIPFMLLYLPAHI
eukprot:scaffold170239_cov26-Attheya_sp.AAC.1